jgi:hypothetical protein
MAFGAGLNDIRATLLDGLIIAGRFTLGASGAVASGSEKGVGWEVTKGAADDGKYKITFDESVADILYARASVLDTDVTLDARWDSATAQTEATFIIVKDDGTSGIPAAATDAELGTAAPDVTFMAVVRRSKLERR